MLKRIGARRGDEAREVEVSWEGLMHLPSAVLPSPPMRARLALPLLLLLAACDSTDGVRLNADYYVGAWTLASISDGTGDRTAEVNGLLDDIAVVFRSDRSFTLTVDFSTAVNTAGQADATVEGTYQAQPDLKTLVLLVNTSQGTFAPTFQASADTATEVSLAAPALIVDQLLGQLQIDFEGEVSLRLRKQ